MEAVGTILKEAREKLGLEIEDAAEFTKIRPKYLMAMEDEKFEMLPSSPVHTLGYLRSYADYLGLDVEDIVNQYKSVNDNLLNHSNDFFTPEHYHPKLVPGTFLIVFSLICFIGIYAGWYASQDDQNEALPSYDLAPEPAPVEEAQPEPTGNIPYLADLHKKNIKIVLIANEDTWVRITDQQNTNLIDQEVKAGDAVFVPDQEGLIISSGLPEAIEVFIDGDVNAFLGTLKEISVQP